MATTTTKLGLTKPDTTDLVDIAVINTDFDKIDAASGATICTSSTRPGTPWNGQIIFETDTLGAFVWRSATSTWTSMGGSTVSSDPPATAANGDLWWDSDNGKLYIYYTDVDGSQWVSVMPNNTTIDVSKNYLINGDFSINQRGFTSATTSGTYGFDRWNMHCVSSGGTGTVTYSAQTFTPGAAPVGGYEGTNYARIVTSGQTVSSEFSQLGQSIEDVRTLAGQTITVSFWAKAASGTPKVGITMAQVSPSTEVLTIAGSVTVSTSWARYSKTITLPSLAGRTLGAGSSLRLMLFTSLGSAYASTHGDIGLQNATIDFWGVQVEKGSVATSFKTATGTIQGELAACQRYYQRITTNAGITFGMQISTTAAYFLIPLIVQMRILPAVYGTNLKATNLTGFSEFTTSTGNLALSGSSLQIAFIGVTWATARGATNALIELFADSSGYIEFVSEL